MSAAPVCSERTLKFVMADDSQTSAGSSGLNATGSAAPNFSLPSFDELRSPEAAAQVAQQAAAAGQPEANSSEYEQSVFRNFMNLQRQWAMNPPPADPMRVSESCATKAAISTTVGGVMGVVVGLVFGTMGGMQPGAMLMPGVPEPPRKAWRHEIRDSLRQTRYKARSWAKNFAFISGTYSGVECVVEKIRGRHDVINSVGAGCITGAGLAVSSGPQVRACVHACVCFDTSLPAAAAAAAPPHKLHSLFPPSS